MAFIKLTYYKPEKSYGNSGGPTTKQFFLAVDSIVRITEYPKSVKLSLNTGDDIEVCETLDVIISKVKTSKKDPTKKPE